METEKSTKSETNKKPSGLKFIILAAGLLLFFLIFVFVFIFLEQNKPDPASETIIRTAVAKQLNKDPNKLTDADFSEITQLNIDNTQISNLDPIKRLKNLRELSAYNNPISDIEPIRELVNLQKLVLDSTQVTNLEPLRDLTRLKELYISKTPISDLRPLSELTNLQKLFIQLCNNLPDQQVKELQKALPDLKIQRALFR